MCIIEVKDCVLVGIYRVIRFLIAEDVSARRGKVNLIYN
jgi:hypothetical protein